MSFAEIKNQVPELSEDERRQLLNLILEIRESEDQNFRDRLADKIDSKDSDRWVPVERLGEFLRKD